MTTMAEDGGRTGLRKSAGLVVLAVCFAALLVPWARQPDDRLLSCLHDFAHFPLFFVITGALCWMLSNVASSQWRAGAVVILALSFGLGLLVERVQPYVGREAGLEDLFLGAAGSAAAVGLFCIRRAAGRPSRWALAGSSVVLLLLSSLPTMRVVADRAVARREFPVLASFESPWETGRWTANHGTVDRVRDGATDGRYAMRFRVTEAAAYPGVFLVDCPHDWNGLHRIHMDVSLPGCDARLAWLRVDDRRDPPYSGRFQKMMNLSPGMNRLTIERDELVTPAGQALDLQHVVALGVFLEAGREGEELVLDNVRLETD